MNATSTRVKHSGEKPTAPAEEVVTALSTFTEGRRGDWPHLYLVGNSTKLDTDSLPANTEFRYLAAYEFSSGPHDKFISIDGKYELIVYCATYPHQHGSHDPNRIRLTSWDEDYDECNTAIGHRKEKFIDDRSK